MIDLKTMLTEIKKAEIVKLMKKYFDYYSKKYFKNEYKKYTYPKFEVKPNLKSIGNYSPQRNTFTMNLDFAQDSDALKSTVAHEIIHYYQTKGGQEFSKMMFKIHGYHDDYFKEKMKKINAGEGENLVTIVGSYKTIKTGKAVKPFWVYVLKRQNTYRMAWSPTKNERFIDRIKTIKDFYKFDSAFVFQTDTVIFKENPRASMGGRGIKTGEIEPGDKYFDEMKKEFKSAKKEEI